MSDTPIEPVKLAAPWMDERSHAMLREFFRVGLRARCVLVEPDRAQAIIIDVDRGDATRRLHDARQHWPEVPIIELSVNYTDQALFVRKPLRPKGMARALQSVRHKLRLSMDPETECVEHEQAPASEPAPAEADTAAPASIALKGPVPEPGTESHYVGQASDLDPHASDTWPRAVYDPTRFLQGYLQRAAAMADESGHPVALTGVWGSWTIPPGNGPVSVTMPDHHLRTLCLVEIADREVRLESLGEGGALTDLPAATTRDALLWKITLWTARGRVPVGTPFNAPVYLRHWPDLNTLLVPPDAMRIAALWLNHPIDLLALAERLGVPQRHVFSLYAASAALGLAGPARRAADSLIAPPHVSAGGMRGLINRLSERLGLSGQTESA